MNENTVKNWMCKADNDLRTGKDELTMEDPIIDTICFHMQQCGEKYSKSFLFFLGREVPRIHSLAALFEQCAEIDSDFLHINEQEVNLLTGYAIITRNGDDFTCLL